LNSLRAWAPAVAATVIVLLFGTLYVLDNREQYVTLLIDWGAPPFRFPFLDIHGVLAAIECHRRGIDVYAQNPCDVFGRVHVYSPLWLYGSALPITTAWTPAVGLGAVVLFLLSLALLPPGRGWWQTGVITLGASSGVVAWAIERANVDIIVFLLAALAARLVQWNRWLRLSGYGVALLAAMLKFYPAVLLILAVRERRTVFFAIGVLSAGAMGGFLAFYGHDLARILPAIPTTSYFDTFVFGARNFPYGMASILGWPGGAASALLVVLIVGMIVCAAACAWRGDLRARIETLSAAECAFLLIGCTLLLTCFLAAQNVQYRAIFLLFMLPGMTALAGLRGRRRSWPYIAGCVLVLLLLWEETIHHTIDPLQRQFSRETQHLTVVPLMFWLSRELLWWVVATMQAVLLIALLLRSRAVREISFHYGKRTTPPPAP
jgi:hypothetical protein